MSLLFTAFTVVLFGALVAWFEKSSAILVVLLLVFNIYNTAYNEYWAKRRAVDEELKKAVHFPLLPKEWSARFQYVSSMIAIIALLHRMNCTQETAGKPSLRG